jgi:hypothetical protein
VTQIANIGNPRAIDPAHHAAAVIPNDAVDLPAASTAIYIGVSGNLKVTSSVSSSVCSIISWSPRGPSVRAIAEIESGD